MSFSHANNNKFASENRKNMTEWEARIWYRYLRELPVKFTRQKMIGNYIVDFYCHSARLIIELDGSYHNEENRGEYELRRDAYFNSIDLLVLHIENKELDRDFNSVCTRISEIIESRIKEPPDSAGDDY